MEDALDYFYDRNKFFDELSQSIERKKLSKNAAFTNYFKFEFKDVVQHNGLNDEEMTIICKLLCTVDLNLFNFKQFLLVFVPEEPTIPSKLCEDLIIWSLSVYRKNDIECKKVHYFFNWLLYVVEEKLTNLDAIDKYYNFLFMLCNIGNLCQPVAGIVYCLTKPEDVQKWMITRCKIHKHVHKNQPHIDKLLALFESLSTVQETRCKGLFDNKTKYYTELAFGLRSVRKEIAYPHASTYSRQLTEFRRQNFDGVSFSKIHINNEKPKFVLPSAKDLAKAYMRPSISNNSLLHLNNISGWCKLLMNTDEQLNLQQRFSNNLAHTLDQILKNELNWPEPKKKKFLYDILQFQKFAHRGLAAVNGFIFQYLLSWDGIQYVRIVYELFEYLSFTSEEELKIRFLEKLHALFISGDEIMYKMIITSLTNLVCNLHLNARQTKTVCECKLFGPKLRETTEFEIVKSLIEYVSHCCSMCVYHYPEDEQLKHTVYTFFEKVSVLENLEPAVWPFWTIMPPNVFYNGLMSINLCWLDRLAKLMLRHINYDTDRIAEISETAWIEKTLRRFELYMADLYNALRLGKLFDKRKEGFLFSNLNECEIEKDLRMVNLNLCFHLEKHIALAPYFMKIGNANKHPMDILQTEAPNVYNLLSILDEKLQMEDSYDSQT
ncbi:uncharacterized protein LOC126832782 [Adelges cooleyi]|uniref:uncharacterized protein LOC126832782 n=1 Tax=Adelges cooleyi TaxID=133065 RepID=UPI0021803043|nr:uncharacterized protein LOC126832782 [Adelges cooleyi]